MAVGFGFKNYLTISYSPVAVLENSSEGSGKKGECQGVQSISEKALIWQINHVQLNQVEK